MSVLLCTEGTYPFHQGGVSTWCDTLVQRLQDLDYTIFAIVTDPFVVQKFTLPKTTKLVRMPLWGTDEPSEHLNVRFSSTYLAKQRTTDEVIVSRFLPIFDAFIRELVAENKDPDKFATIIVSLYDFFFEFDYKVAFKSPLVWSRYKRLMNEFTVGPHPLIAAPDLYGLIQSLGWVYRFFNIINTRVPETSVTHAAAAAFCGLPGVIAKVKYNTPMLLTEHGVYTREQYLSLSKRGYSSFLNTFLIRMVQSVINVTYAYADQISPVCEYNTRWEKKLTDRHERIQVIYNGVDHRVFTRVEPQRHERPTVVTVARIDPIKDILTLIRAAHIVRQSIPNVRFIVYGSVTVPEYQVQCEELITKLELAGTVELFGHMSDMAAAYESGDIVLQSSISEAFPYAVIEAMLSAKPVVSTAVGGVPEAVGDTGILVIPGDPEEMAKAVVELLSNPQAILERGQESRRRALDLFTLDKCLAQYMRTYIKLAVTGPVVARRTVHRHRTPVIRSGNRQKAADGMRAEQFSRLHAERAMALLERGFIDESLHQLEIAWTHARSPAAREYLSALLSALHALSNGLQQVVPASAPEALQRGQQLYAERAYALAQSGHLHGAIAQMQAAVAVDANSLALPVLLGDIATWSGHLGLTHQAAEYRLKSAAVEALFA